VYRSFAIVPAAGTSVRMGTPKLLLPWHGKTVIEHVLSAWRKGGVSKIVLVARRGDIELIARARDCGAELVEADPPPVDMKASVRAGLAFIAQTYKPRAGDVWSAAPADLPRLSCDCIRTLLAAHKPESARVLIACHQGQKGHPVLFPWNYAAKIDDLAGDEGLNHLISRSMPIMIECGEGAVGADLDTPADYERLTG
jgi:molybdenum cofactor cytidylyltransferase